MAKFYKTVYFRPYKLRGALDIGVVAYRIDNPDHIEKVLKEIETIFQIPRKRVPRPDSGNWLVIRLDKQDKVTIFRDEYFKEIFEPLSAKSNETERFFEIFKNECLRLQKEFGLTDCQINFKLVKLKDRHSLINYNYDKRIATIHFNSDICKDKEIKLNDEFVKLCAKREIIHLLLSELEVLAYTRFLNIGDVNTAIEKLVAKLTNLINV